MEIIHMLYFSKKFSAIPGNKIAINPVPKEAPQIGAPIVQVSIAIKPIKKKIKPINDVFLVLAKIIFYFIFLIKQVNNDDEIKMKLIARMRYSL